MRDSITADMLLTAAQGAYSGRLTIDPNTGSISYCTGQYWPTEYRRAVCAVLASAVWAWLRDECMPAGSRQGATDGAMLYRNPAGRGFVSAGDWLRTKAAREFGRSIASRWFQ
jgi:hypothetical protein